MLHIRFLAIRPSSPISGELLVTHWFDTAIGTDERTALLAIAINELDSAASAHGGDVEYVRVDDPLGGPDDRLAIVVVEHNDIALIAALSESETDAAHILYARHVLAQLCKALRICVLGEEPTCRSIAANHVKVKHLLDEMLAPSGHGCGDVRYYDMNDIGSQCHQWFSQWPTRFGRGKQKTRAKK